MSRRKDKLKEVLPGLGAVLRFFWPDVRRQAGLLVASVFALLAGVVLGLLEPWPLKWVVDQVLPPRMLASETAGPAAMGGAAGSTADEMLALAACALVVICLLRAVAEYAGKVGFLLIGNRTVVRVRDRVFRHLYALSLDFHHRARQGDLVIRVTRDVSLIRDVVSTAVLPLASSVLVLFGMLCVMFWMNWRLALAALITMPLFWLTTIRIGRRIRETARKQRRREGAMAALAAESLGAIEAVQALSLERLFAQRFSRRNRKSEGEDLKANRLSARLGRTVDVLLAVSTAIVLWCGGRLVLAGQLSTGDLLVFLVYVKRAFRPAQDFAKYTARLAKATAAGERVIDLLERPSQRTDDTLALAAPPFRGDIRFEAVSFEYEPGYPVLRDVNLEIPAGRRVAVTGESGVGKSTIARLLLRLYNPSRGTVQIDGQDLQNYTLESLRSQISVVPQDAAIFATSVWENIGCAAEGVTGDEILAAARLANADRFIEALPDGYGTVLGERGVSLSRGQRQRIAIARAAVRNAPIMLLDEPTTGLDEENRIAVIHALERLTAGRTTLIMTHDLELAARADVIYHLVDGTLAEEGSHRELMEAGGSYAAVARLRYEQ